MTIPPKNDALSILLIEDNMGDAQLVLEMLAEVRNPQCLVTHVGVARKAVQLLKNQKFHAILLDLSLPDTFGLETVDSILETSPDTPIIIVSGFSCERLAVQALKMGVQDFLVKSEIDGSRLLRTICIAIERNQRLSRLRDQVKEAESYLARSSSLEQTGCEYLSLVNVEIRLCLAAVQEVLKQEVNGAATAERFFQIENCRVDLAKFSTILEDAFCLEALRAGRIHMQNDTVQIKPMIEKIVSTVHAKTLGGSCSISIAPINETLNVRGDRGIMELILSSLIENAMPLCNENCEIMVGIHSENDAAELFVERMPCAASGQISEPPPSEGLFQRDQSRIRGLSLLIARELVKVHGSSLKVDNELREGDQGRVVRLAFALHKVESLRHTHAVQA